MKKENNIIENFLIYCVDECTDITTLKELENKKKYNKSDTVCFSNDFLKKYHKTHSRDIFKLCKNTGFWVDNLDFSNKDILYNVQNLNSCFLLFDVFIENNIQNNKLRKFELLDVLQYNVSRFDFFNFYFSTPETYIKNSVEKIIKYLNVIFSKTELIEFFVKNLFFVKNIISENHINEITKKEIVKYCTFLCNGANDIDVQIDVILKKYLTIELHKKNTSFVKLEDIKINLKAYLFTLHELNIFENSNFETLLCGCYEKLIFNYIHALKTSNNLDIQYLIEIIENYVMYSDKHNIYISPVFIKRLFIHYVNFTSTFDSFLFCEREQKSILKLSQLIENKNLL